MFARIFQLITGFICGYLFILWFPISSSGGISEMIVIFVMEPFSFFASMAIFIIGFTANAEIIRKGIELTAIWLRQRKANFLELLLCSSFVAGFTILFNIAFWQTLSLFCFSVIYGIISLDFKKPKVAED